jgi:hypothetical protein
MSKHTRLTCSKMTLSKMTFCKITRRRKTFSRMTLAKQYKPYRLFLFNVIMLNVVAPLFDTQKKIFLVFSKKSKVLFCYLCYFLISVIFCQVQITPVQPTGLYHKTHYDRNLRISVIS